MAKKLSKPNDLHLATLAHHDKRERLEQAKVKPLSSEMRKRVGDGRDALHYAHEN